MDKTLKKSEIKRSFEVFFFDFFTVNGNVTEISFGAFMSLLLLVLLKHSGLV